MSSIRYTLPYRQLRYRTLRAQNGFAEVSMELCCERFPYIMPRKVSVDLCRGNLPRKSAAESLPSVIHSTEIIHRQLGYRHLNSGSPPHAGMRCTHLVVF